MIQSVTNIDTVIEGVEEIVVEAIDQWVLDRPQRVIIVRTKHNENYYLKLQADEREKIELHRDLDDKREDWLTPKIYKGQSAHDEEMEEEDLS